MVESLARLNSECAILDPMDKPERFQTRSVDVEAMQWTGANDLALWDWIGTSFMGGRQPRLHVATITAWRDLQRFDWVVKDDAGFQALNDHQFHERYRATERLFPESTIAECMAVAMDVANGAASVD